MKFFHVYGWHDCPYCVKACGELQSKNLPVLFSLLDYSDELLNYYKTKYNWKTVPIIVLQENNSNEEKFIGGYTDLLDYLRGRESNEDGG